MKWGTIQSPEKTADKGVSGHLESQTQGSKLQKLAKDNWNGLNKRPTVYNPNLKSTTTIKNFILESTHL